MTVQYLSDSNPVVSATNNVHTETSLGFSNWAILRFNRYGVLTIFKNVLYAQDVDEIEHGYEEMVANDLIDAILYL